MIGARKGGRVGARPGGGGRHWRMNKTIPCGWGSSMGVFFNVGSLFFPWGAGLREGGQLLSTFRLFLREHAGPGGGGGYRIIIVI